MGSSRDTGPWTLPALRAAASEEPQAEPPLGGVGSSSKGPREAPAAPFSPDPALWFPPPGWVTPLPTRPPSSPLLLLGSGPLPSEACGAGVWSLPLPTERGPWLSHLVHTQSQTNPGGIPQLLTLGIVRPFPGPGPLLSPLSNVQASHATSSRKPSLVFHPPAPHLALSS